MALRKKLSPAIVEGAKPEASPYRIWDVDVPSLFLRVQPSGVKSWNVQWSRTASAALGKWPGMTVSAARDRARKSMIEATEHGAPLAVTERNKPKSHTLRSFIADEYRPWATANQKWGEGAADRLAGTFAEFADKPLSDINAWVIEKWRSKRIKSGVSANTCNRDLATLKSALNRAKAWGILSENPLAAVRQAKVDSSRIRYLSDAENGRLRATLADRDSETRAARARANQWRAERGKETMPTIGGDEYGDHLTPAILISLNTGLRRGELTALTWADVNLEARMLTVRAAAAKSGKSRHVPLNNEALMVLTQWQQQQPTGRLFPVRSFKTAWGKLMATAKIDGFRWHDMRHDFASRLVMAGVDLNTVRELMGHADLKMTLRYAHLAPAHLAEAVARLGAVR